MNWDQERSIAAGVLDADGRRSALEVFTVGAGFAWILTLLGAAPIGWFGLVLLAIGLLWPIYAAFRDASRALRRDHHHEAARVGAHWQTFYALDLEYRNRRMAARHRDDPELIEFLNRAVNAWTTVRSDVDSGAIDRVGAPFDRPLMFAVLRSMQRRDLEGRLSAAVATLDQALKAGA